jgi:hypothetical protein
MTLGTLRGLYVEVTTDVPHRRGKAPLFGVASDVFVNLSLTVSQDFHQALLLAELTSA